MKILFIMGIITGVLGAITCFDSGNSTGMTWALYSAVWAANCWMASK